MMHGQKTSNQLFMKTRYANSALKNILYDTYIHIYKLVCIYADVTTSYVRFVPSSFTLCFS